ncbi:hypothetical protein ABPG77_003640 [Micractinium sp. CCAP 211/92]
MQTTPCVGCSAAEADAAILLQLRASVHAWNPAWSGGWDGWQLASGAAPCAWHGVTCDRQGRVLKLVLASSETLFASTGVANFTNWKWRAEVFPFGSKGGPGPLLPALARLRRLRHLEVSHLFAGLEGGIPQEWCLSGAFPSLTRLRLAARSLGAPLPDIQPGALRALRLLFLEMPWLQTSLPASWGASPAVLPSLEELSVQAVFTGMLPPAWHRGFPSLRELSLRNRHTNPPPLPGALPGEWAEGFPRLLLLGLVDVRLSEPTLPAAWAEGGFPLLQTLQLFGMALRGSLPATLLPAHPSLRVLGLSENRFNGSLPAAWAAHEGIEMVDVRDNLLTGTPFPPAWLHVGALPSLKRLEVSNNVALGGTLPASLPWTSIQEIDVAFTKMSGSVPSAWCNASFNATLRYVNIAGTDISEDLPSCANRCMPLFSLEGITPPDDSSGAAPLVFGRSIAAVVTLAAALAALAAAWGYRLRRRRRLDKRSCEERGLLLPRQPTPACGADRRRRLSALLTRQLASEGGSGIDVLPLDSLPEQFTHHVGAAGGSTAGGGAMRPLAWASSDEVGSTGSKDSSSREGSWGWPSSTSSAARQLPEPPLPRRGASAAPAPAGAGSVSLEQAGGEHLASRQWGLETRGLRLQPEALEIVAGPDDSLVELGAGSHAAVYLGRLGNRQVAVKVFELHPGLHSHAIWQEAALMRRCSHPRVLPLLGIALKGQMLLLVTELMQGGSLRAALEDPQRRSLLRWDAHGRQVALDVAEALAYLHGALQMRHTDLKASNVLLSEGWRACVSDLGMAQMVGQEARSAAGFTATHAAPEQLLAQRCSLAADVYSLGLVLAELTTGQVVKRRGEWQPPRPPDECPAAVAELIQRCTQPEPAARPSAAEVLRVLSEA